MSKLLLPDWTGITELFSKARKDLLVCTPYYSPAGLAAIEFHTRENVDIQFFTKLDIAAWISGAADPQRLLKLFQRLAERSGTSSILSVENLHAKVYARDRSELYIGSANLTTGGFARNLELVIRQIGPEAKDTIQSARDILEANAKEVSLAQLRSWIEAHEAQVNAAKALQLTAKPPSQAFPIRVDENLFETFKTWLETQSTDIAGVSVLSSHMNGFQNRQGHFRQSFFGSVRFLTEHPDLVAPLNAELEFESADIVDLRNGPIEELWTAFLYKNRLETAPYYSLSILRNVLPPALGGTSTGGGGASGTFRRMLPLVARFIFTR